MNLNTIKDGEGRKIYGYKIYENNAGKYIKRFGLIGRLEVVKNTAYQMGKENLYTYKVHSYTKA
jgi:hypothetical protein|tara:strand:+ start:273 stop:464 length:192 start_codon:yes stop_codon:yes gene_type:complete